MWMMSKLVLLIFLFGLLTVLTGFLGVYQEKVISDTARDNTALLSEVANTALSFQAAGGTYLLDPLIIVSDQNQQYTIVVRAIAEDSLTNDRVVFLFAWLDHEDMASIDSEGGFASASALEMPPAVSDDDYPGAGRIWFFDGQVDGEFELLDPAHGDLFVRPSLSAAERDQYMLFYRNRNVFCVATMVQGIDLGDTLDRLAHCCVADDNDMPLGCDV